MPIATVQKEMKLLKYLKNMKQLFQTPAVIEKIQTLADGGNKLSVTTSELSSDEMTKLFELRNKEGFFLFKENYIKKEDVPDEEAIIEKNEKTPSQRLRARMFVFFKETHKDTKGFLAWYNEQLDQIGNKYLDKLN